MVAVLFVTSLAACSTISVGAPSPTPADFPGIAGELTQRGITVDRIVSGDGGCADTNLARTAIAFDASGLDQATPVRVRVYIFRNRATSGPAPLHRGHVYRGLCQRSRHVRDGGRFALCRRRPGAVGQGIQGQHPRGPDGRRPGPAARPAPLPRTAPNLTGPGRTPPARSARRHHRPTRLGTTEPASRAPVEAILGTWLPDVRATAACCCRSFSGPSWPARLQGSPSPTAGADGRGGAGSQPPHRCDRRCATRCGRGRIRRRRPVARRRVGRRRPAAGRGRPGRRPSPVGHSGRRTQVRSGRIRRVEEPAVGRRFGQVEFRRCHELPRREPPLDPVPRDQQGHPVVRVLAEPAAGRRGLSLGLCRPQQRVLAVGHAWSTFKPLHDAYVGGRLRKGMKVIYADGGGTRPHLLGDLVEGHPADDRGIVGLGRRCRGRA